jgi:predicted Rossmann-fold nucleotide-binding protein
MKRICVFCGSNSGGDPVYLKRRSASVNFSPTTISSWFMAASGWLMGKIADAVMANGGRVIGIIPAALDEKEIAHRGITELRVVDSMHERRQ